MARQERATSDLSTVVFRNGEAGERQTNNYLKFYQRYVQATRYVDHEYLTELGLLEGVEWMLTNSSFTQLCTTPLTLEFLSSYSYSLNQTQIVRMLGFLTWRRNSLLHPRRMVRDSISSLAQPHLHERHELGYA